MDAAVLVAGDRGVAGDHRRLADARDAAQAEPRGDDALVHHALAGERRVLLVQGDDPADELLVLQRLAQDAGAVDGLAVVGEAERAALSSSAISVSASPARPLVTLARKPTGMRASRRACSSARAGRERSRSSATCSAGRRWPRSRRRPRSACRSRGPPCAPGRARAGARAGPRNPGRGGGPGRRWSRRRRCEVLADGGDLAVSDEHVELGVELVARVQDVGALDQDVRGVDRSVVEHQAGTGAEVRAGRGAWRPARSS